MRTRLSHVAAALVILNAIDALFTVVYVHLGMATEGNPLMSGPLATSPVLFVIAKSGLVSLCVLLLWRMRMKGLAVVGLIGTAAAYSVLICYHLSAVPRLVAMG